MKKIIVIQRDQDYKAYLESDPAIWGSGKTTQQAIGDLVAAYPEVFDIEVEMR